MAGWAVEFLGPTLLTKDGEKDTAEVMAGKKAVCIYFSAHWCPPCRGFTPVLAEAYEAQGDKDVEVVFVSSDGSEDGFNEYYELMPWVAIPFASLPEFKGGLSSKYSVR